MWMFSLLSEEASFMVFPDVLFSMLRLGFNPMNKRVVLDPLQGGAGCRWVWRDQKGNSGTAEWDQWLPEEDYVWRYDFGGWAQWDATGKDDVFHLLPGLSETQHRYKWFIIIARGATVTTRSGYLMFLLSNICMHIKTLKGLFILKGKKCWIITVTL